MSEDIVNSSMCNSIDEDLTLNPFTDSRETWSFTTIVAMSAILNILLIYGLHRTSRPFSMPTTMFFLISLTDLLNTLLPLIEKILNAINENYSNTNLICFLITLISFLRWLTYFIQVILLGFLSTLRFISIYRPLVIITTKKLTISLVMAFTLSCGLNLCIFVMDYVEMQKETMILVYIYDNFLFIMILYITICLLYTSPSPRDATLSRMPSSA